MVQDDEKDIPRVFRVKERRAEIARILEAEGSITVDRICDQFEVSAVTARGDLNELERRGHLQRVHGGALPLDHTLVVADINDRMGVNVSAKRKIARAAAGMVRDGDSIIIDSGSTTFEFVTQLEGKENITIVTHDLVIANFVNKRLPNATLVLLGGTLRYNHHYFCGALSLELVRKIYADKAFFAANSFTEEQGFMTESEAAGEIKSTLLSHARQRIMLMDYSKVGLHNFVRFATLEDIDRIIIDRDPEGYMRRAVSRAENDTHLVIA
ncbi:MAG TPA: DeoR/GlpR family DNA-binding transcription regulator [Atopobiaceae bacterium]|mgnify:CR=1 FL=1|nr:DeoR/GlpR family DNA-binding transcription regulator [Atopobiaceae bacterium]